MIQSELLSNLNESEEIITNLSSHAKLLIATDFDGTISEFTENPEDSVLDPLARIALRKLSELPNTFVAVISGRKLSDLALRFRELERVRLVGSHGHEFDVDQVSSMSQEMKLILERSIHIIQESVKRCPGSSIETKPHGAVFHFRSLKTEPTQELQLLRENLSKLGQGIVREGNKILEYSVVETDKGDALSRIKEQILPTITLYIGDDVTDEAAFAKMAASDISIKVGNDPSLATYRLSSSSQAIHLLVLLAEKRSEWLRAASTEPIDSHFFLSDLRTAALVDQRGSLTWLCVPRIDGVPLFGSLVGGPGAGHFRIYAEDGIGKQDYLDNTLISKTDFGSISLTDFFDCSDGRTYQRAGRSDLVRIIEGTGLVFFEYAPKLNFGRVRTRMYKIADGLRLECGQQQVILHAPGVEWSIFREGMHDLARAQASLKSSRIVCTLLMGTGSAVTAMQTCDEELSQTKRFWEGWLNTLRLPNSYSKLVSRSALVLRGLCYGPSGAIAAAATTSLPETLGGVRNWDYRYCWPRDASMAASALLRLNAPGPAIRLLDWLIGIILDNDEPDQFLAPLYTVTGRVVIGEAEVPEATGYSGSRPVRIGNLAADQLQLDSLGPIAQLMHELVQSKATLTSEHFNLAERLVHLVASRWSETDSGIWEVRGAQRHFVHSKLMCWYTVECCASVAHYLGIERPEWLELAAQIRAEIENKGFNKELNSYVAAYDLNEADSALLWIILAGFHPPDHSRSLGTLNFILERLVHNDCVYRYHFDDALQGQEGEFIICRCWLIEVLAMMKKEEEAKRFLDVMLSRMSNLGLLAEQWDSKHRVALGNYPQAYSHIGLINAVCALEKVNKD